MEEYQDIQLEFYFTLHKLKLIHQVRVYWDPEALGGRGKEVLI